MVAYVGVTIVLKAIEELFCPQPLKGSFLLLL